MSNDAKVVSESFKTRSRETFGEDVDSFVLCRKIRKVQVTSVNMFMHKVKINLNVFRARILDRIRSHIGSTEIVEKNLTQM
jgi:hypothetical protein